MFPIKRAGFHTMVHTSLDGLQLTLDPLDSQMCFFLLCLSVDQWFYRLEIFNGTQVEIEMLISPLLFNLVAKVLPIIMK